MTENDFYDFVDTWKGTHEVFGSAPTDAAIAISFKVLADHGLLEVKQGIAAHLSDPNLGRFAPKPADIIKQITGKLAQDGRPEADEAWSIAVQSFDEAATVVLNNEIAASLEMSRPIYNDGDKVGARMAFRAAYDREIEEARKNKVAVKWFASLGHDIHSRKSVLENAVEKNLLSRSHIQTLLPAPLNSEGAAIAGYLSGKVSTLPKNKEAADRLSKLKEALNLRKRK